MSLFNRCEHEWKVDYTHGSIYEFSGDKRPTSIYTKIVWVCQKCPKVRTKKVRGAHVRPES